jgi:hypothetical protein
VSGTVLGTACKDDGEWHGRVKGTLTGISTDGKIVDVEVDAKLSHCEVKPIELEQVKMTAEVQLNESTLTVTMEGKLCNVRSMELVTTVVGNGPEEGPIDVEGEVKTVVILENGGPISCNGTPGGCFKARVVSVG